MSKCLRLFIKTSLTPTILKLKFDEIYLNNFVIKVNFYKTETMYI